MISDVLFQAIEDIEQYERDFPNAYSDPEMRAKIARVKETMHDLQRDLDTPPVHPQLAADGTLGLRETLRRVLALALSEEVTITSTRGDPITGSVEAVGEDYVAIARRLSATFATSPETAPPRKVDVVALAHVVAVSRERERERA